MAEYNSRGRTQAQPGAALKVLRAERNWTLADVSRKTGMPVSSLSKIENNRVQLTFGKITHIAKALDVDVSRFIGDMVASQSPAGGAARRSINKEGEGRTIDVKRGSYLYLSTEILNKHMIPIVGDVTARDIATYGEFSCHPGEEFVYVLEGTLELHTEVYAPTRLEKGESAYFDSNMAHAYISVGSSDCRILSICSDPDGGSLR